MSDRDRRFSSALARRIRRSLGALRRAPLRVRSRCRVAGIDLVVPRGVRHPLADGGAAFFFRTVGPMIAPGQAVLVLAAASGLGALVAGSRGAIVTAIAESETAAGAIAVNLQAHGLADQVTVLRDRRDAAGPFDLVLAEVGDVAPGSLEGWLGERGRLVTLEPLADEPARTPPGYRSVRLARSPGAYPSYEVTSLGWDLERARAERHAARGSDDTVRRATVSRRKWEGVDPETWAERVAENLGEDGIPTG
jgi:hypothetical protein